MHATRKAMGQISGAIVGVTVALISVFVPLAFFCRLGGQHLPPVLGGDGGLDRVLGLSSRCRSRRRCAPLCSSRWKPATTMRRPASSAGSTAVSPARPRATRAWVARILKKRRALPDHLRWRSAWRWRSLYKRLPTSFLPARRPGQHDRQRAAAPRRHARAHAGGDEAGRGITSSSQPEVQEHGRPCWASASRARARTQHSPS